MFSVCKASFDPVETRYMRSDSADVSVSLVTYTRKLGLTQTSTYESHTRSRSGSGYTAQWGIRVYVRHADGSLTELTSGTPVAVVQRSSAGSGLQSATWSCPQTALSSTDRIFIQLCVRWIDQSWVTDAYGWLTEQLNAQSLNSATWTVYYYTSYSYSSTTGLTNARIYWDTSSYPTRIEGFSWTLQTKTWHSVEGWSIVLDVLKWHSVEFWSNVLKSMQFNFVEGWEILLKAFPVIVYVSAPNYFFILFVLGVVFLVVALAEFKR